VAESLQESELGVEWLAAQGVAVDPLPELALGVEALPSMGRVAFEALLPEQATSVDQSAAPLLALVLVGAQFQMVPAPAPAPLALEAVEPAGEAAVESEGALPPPAPLVQVQVQVRVQALRAESPGVLEPKLANMGSTPAVAPPAQLEAAFVEKLAADRGMVQSQ